VCQPGREREGKGYSRVEGMAGGETETGAGCGGRRVGEGLLMEAVA
jgi:hypothetical protein